MKPSELIKEKGWCQKYMTDSEGKICLAKAIVQAYKNGDEFFAAWKKISELVTSQGGIISWNDKEGRTVEEVLTLLKSVGE